MELERLCTLSIINIDMIRKRQMHGLSNTALYNRWEGMIGRCYNTNNTYYHNYGGRGIEICDKWRYNYKSFYDYVTQLPNYNLNLTIDRIDNDGNYEPGNIRWVDRYEQVQNQRLFSTNTSGYRNVYFDKQTDQWRVIIEYRNEIVFRKRFNTKLEAIEARNNYLIKNKLPLTKYKELRTLEDIENL